MLSLQVPELPEVRAGDWKRQGPVQCQGHGDREGQGGQEPAVEVTHPNVMNSAERGANLRKTVNCSTKQIRQGNRYGRRTWEIETISKLTVTKGHYSDISG